MTIEAAEAQWLATTQPKTLRLGVFDDAEIEVRRHPSYPGAVCSLDFGCFTGLDGNRHDDRRCLWLSYITSEVPGQGRMLLRWLKAFAAEHGLYIAATPSAVTPEGWSPNRRAPRTVSELLTWYHRHGFNVVEDRSSTLVIYAPSPLALNVTWSVDERVA